jgi:hypothetical protein
MSVLTHWRRSGNNTAACRWHNGQSARIGHGQIQARQRQTYRDKAVALGQNQRTTMQPFFPASILDSARVVVLAGERVSNPHFYGEFLKMGFAAGSLPNFADMATITYVDTVVSNEPFTDRLLFHELVHVVRDEKLGLAKFAAKYGKGFSQRWLLRSHPAGNECL